MAMAAVANFAAFRTAHVHTELRITLSYLAAVAARRICRSICLAGCPNLYVGS